MATDQEKEQLIETLKFTPRNYRIELGAYGGEVYFGAVDRKIYDFFKEHKIDIEEYAGSWDEEMWEFVPEDMRPFEPGSPYDVGGVHESGATFDDTNTIEVFDENGNSVWTCSLGSSALEEAGVTVEESEEQYISDNPEGTVVFYGAQGEKGLLFGNEFELRAPFDPKKLKISYSDYDGWQIVSSIVYDGEDIENNDYDTTGKWSDAKWIILGDEEVYESVSRDDIDNEDDEE
jgi:hypothetical protein